MAYAVIGANFGDEGKGREVSRLAGELTGKTLVVRHNSGAQAGHTVTSRSGMRHVFSHIGSGTLDGADTLLAHKFVINPIVFNREYDELFARGIPIPKIYVDYNCSITTPLDILLNRIIEASRGENKHGSCGLGFGETIARVESNSNLKLCLRDIKYIEKDLEKYFLDQLIERDVMITALPDEYFNLCQNIFNGSFNWEPWFAELKTFMRRVRPYTTLGIQSIIGAYDNVIFEGAQGLLLHQDHHYFPHVTRSRTGLEDIEEMIKKYSLSISSIEPHYCSRSYLTRHGAGPLEYEKTLEQMQQLGYSINDPTNVPNPYQDSLRYAQLDIRNVVSNINDDMSKIVMDIDRPHLIISCCDQYSRFDRDAFLCDMSQIFGFDQRSHISYDKDDIHTYNAEKALQCA